MSNETIRLRVVSGVIVREGRILLTQRGPGQSHSWLWECPGGKVEPGEDDHAALRRELFEELRFLAAVGRPLFSGDFDPPAVSRPYSVNHYLVRIASGYPVAEVGMSGIGWFDADALESLPMMPSVGPRERDLLRDLLRLPSVT